MKTCEQVVAAAHLRKTKQDSYDQGYDQAIRDVEFFFCLYPEATMESLFEHLREMKKKTQRFRQYLEEMVNGNNRAKDC